MAALRERVLHHGPEGLSDGELLKLVAGDEGENALWEAFGLRALLQQDPLELSRVPGVGKGRAARLLAAAELGRRLQRAPETRPVLATPNAIHRHLRPLLSGQRREVFYVLCLNPRNVLLREARVAEGTADSCPVDPREVFAPALAVRASGLVVAHNHPSGDPTPSQADLELTRHLSSGARLLGLRLLDHLVMGGEGYTSFLEHRLLTGGTASFLGPRTLSHG